MANRLQPPDRDNDMPVWRQIEQQVLRQIHDGVLRGGDRLPSALELARQLQVNRHTVRRALDALEERGVVHAETGRGLRVREESYDYAIGRRTSFSRNMNNLNVTSGNRVLGTALVTPPRRVAESLALARGERAWWIESSAHAEGRVLDHGQAWFPAVRFPRLDEVFQRTGSVTRTLAEFGVPDYFRSYTRVTARLAGAVTARILEQAADLPVLEVESLNVDAQNQPVQYGLTCFAAERVQLVLSTPDVVSR
ncbi:phosphonate metabolism transcriptional regulator PhnF [Luteibacter anthropi]|uniref:Phosphonate metabolism transcriptional regulator PhnF n=1 Tax=Luteibacter anthropi TaxID=564369 RepID=A0A7X5UBP1_9GAMM|nr:phosphonate metabolism transcriptional regulator PhnF [Luteibacter anthropi]NII07480.1 phosphonate metabolism transcriptional regulator PhnF [Luteibacter anthropi]URX61218.1 phosphonate metabolism transcriptional regulator PhnF [Luteibacter anthropi]